MDPQTGPVPPAQRARQVWARSAVSAEDKQGEAAPADARAPRPAPRAAGLRFREARNGRCSSPASPRTLSQRPRGTEEKTENSEKVSQACGITSAF